MKKTLLLLAVVLMGLGMMAQTNTYTRVTSASELEAGENYLIVGYDEVLGYCAMSYQKSNNRHAIQVAENGGSITLAPASDPSSQTEAYQITLGGNPGAWTFFDEVKGGYLYAASSTGNQLKTQTTNNANGEWTIVFENDETAVVTANGDNTRNVMRFNENSSNGDPLFNCYLPSSTAGVTIAFYKAGGAPVINPEPSNYPTNFAGYVDLTRVNLTWTASTGEQLPRGYVVLGSTGDITIPVDGTPVANDTDPSDGHVAYNTNGTTVYFDQLTANTTWHFAIFPYTNSGENINYKTDGTYPTTNVTTQNVNCIFQSDFANGLAPFTAVNVEGEQVWTTNSYQGSYYAGMNGYAGGANNANEDWLITPDILNGNTYNDITIAFKNAYKFDGNALQVLYTQNYDNNFDPNDFNWTDITANFDWSTGNYAWVPTNYTLSNMQSVNHLYIAFKYTSTTEASSSWEIADFKIYTSYDAVDEVEAMTFGLYPNPASSNVTIVAEAAAEAQIMDMAGRVVMSVNVNAGENNINVADLADGVYFVRMNSAVVKFVKR